MSESSHVPARAGVGLKAQHYAEVLAQRPEVGFFEVHAENYMGAGGPPHRYLTEVRSRYPLSLHGVGLSIGADRPLEREHLRRLADLIERYQPGLFSEHLAWSTHGRAFYNDLLPVPYTRESLQKVIDHVDEVQQTLGRRLLLENPSTYLIYRGSTLSEPQFIAEIVRRTGCHLLLDVNNLHIACTNHGWDPNQYLEELPSKDIRQIHLAGHAEDRDASDRRLLIDSHDRRVAESVWQLYGAVMERIGPTPTLIEWDARLPTWTELLSEAQRAQKILDGVARRPRGKCLAAVV